VLPVLVILIGKFNRVGSIKTLKPTWAGLRNIKEKIESRINSTNLFWLSIDDTLGVDV